MNTHVEQIMGPAPEKAPPASQSATPIAVTHADDTPKAEASDSLASAAEEANRVLKSIDPDLSLGDATIAKIDEPTEMATAPSATEVPVPTQTIAEAMEASVAEEADDPLIEKAVDDIVAHEGDEV